jgi:hypothetical protein
MYYDRKYFKLHWASIYISCSAKDTEPYRFDAVLAPLVHRENFVTKVQIYVIFRRMKKTEHILHPIGRKIPFCITDS